MLQDGNFNENVTFYNITGMAIYGNSNYTPFGTLTLTSCTGFQGYSFGVKNVYASNCSLLSLNSVMALGTDQTTIGFYLYNCHTYDWNFITADYSSLGISCTDGTEADIPNSNITNDIAGLQAFNGSNVTIDNSVFAVPL
jgi:hypothetical protein